MHLLYLIISTTRIDVIYLEIDKIYNLEVEQRQT